MNTARITMTTGLLAVALVAGTAHAGTFVSVTWGDGDSVVVSTPSYDCYTYMRYSPSYTSYRSYTTYAVPSYYSVTYTSTPAYYSSRTISHTYTVEPSETYYVSRTIYRSTW